MSNQLPICAIDYVFLSAAVLFCHAEESTGITIFESGPELSETAAAMNNAALVPRPIARHWTVWYQSIVVLQPAGSGCEPKCLTRDLLRGSLPC